MGSAQGGEGGRGGTILMIEDEASIVQLVRLYLEEAGYTMLTAPNGIAGLDAYTRERPDLVILDLMLPGLDGYEVCKRIRASAQTPILILTARRTEDDRVLGLELGADDYVTKPFSPRELVSRVRAILRRTSAPAGAAAAESETLSFPGLVIRPVARKVEVDGKAAELTAKEFDLLLALARAPEQVFSREALLSKVWGYDYLGDSRTVDVHIGTLRKKVEPDPAHPRYIKTVWTVGYTFDPSGIAG
jgi:two-component system response regulator ResD